MNENERKKTRGTPVPCFSGRERILENMILLFIGAIFAHLMNYPEKCHSGDPARKTGTGNAVSWRRLYLFFNPRNPCNPCPKNSFSHFRRMRRIAAFGAASSARNYPSVNALFSAPRRIRRIFSYLGKTAPRPHQNRRCFSTTPPIMAPIAPPPKTASTSPQDRRYSRPRIMGFLHWNQHLLADNERLFPQTEKTPIIFTSMFNATFRIGERSIGRGHPCFIIAEVGSNHDRKLDQALELIDIAASAGADAVKFQTYSAETLYSRKTPVMSYLKKKEVAEEGESVWEMIKRIEMPREWHAGLARHCEKRGVIFLSTPFDEKAVDELEEAGVLAYKIASFEITHLPLIRKAAETGKPLILSTGMANLTDIETALEAVRQTGNENVALLHCAINYPPRYEDLNLRAMDTMRSAFGVPIGFSDHTLDIVTDVAAVARGADIVEKHYTLSRKLKGPDHQFALEPGELREMCAAVRNTERALGSPEKRRTEAEEELHRLARRSLVAARAIPAGEKIARSMLAVKRPGFGIHPSMIEAIEGKTAAVDIEEDDILTWKHIK